MIERPLTAHDARQTESEKPFAILDNAHRRRELLERTDGLLEMIKKEKIGTVVFLDKSARPISWLLRDRFKHHNPKATPFQTKFLNVGGMEKDRAKRLTENLQEEHDQIRKTMTEKDAKEDRRIEYDAEIRALQYAIGNAYEQDVFLSPRDLSQAWRQTVKNHPEILNKIRDGFHESIHGERVLIIDELMFTGTTLQIAMTLLAEAFPDAEIHGIHFFHQQSRHPTSQIPWFKQPHLIGVQERSDVQEIFSERYVPKNGEKEDRSRTLREEIKRLAKT